MMLLPHPNHGDTGLIGWAISLLVVSVACLIRLFRK
jgi:hypothetical protein